MHRDGEATARGLVLCWGNRTSSVRTRRLDGDVLHIGQLSSDTRIIVYGARVRKTASSIIPLFLLQDRHGEARQRQKGIHVNNTEKEVNEQSNGTDLSEGEKITYHSFIEKTESGIS